MFFLFLNKPCFGNRLGKSSQIRKKKHHPQFIHKQELIIQTSYNHIISVLLKLQRTT